MTKSQIFKTAWALAKQGASKFGGTSKDYFSASLKLAYNASKRDWSAMAISILSSYKSTKGIYVSRFDEQKHLDLFTKDLSNPLFVAKVVALNLTDEIIVAEMTKRYIRIALKK